MDSWENKFDVFYYASHFISWTKIIVPSIFSLLLCTNMIFCTMRNIGISSLALYPYIQVVFQAKTGRAMVPIAVIP